MKYLIIPLCLTLTACVPGNTRPDHPQDQCADRAVFKEYKFDMPVKPKLNTIPEDKAGIVVRNIESQYLDLMEYAIKLENIVVGIPKVN